MFPGRESEEKQAIRSSNLKKYLLYKGSNWLAGLLLLCRQFHGHSKKIAKKNGAKSTNVYLLHNDFLKLSLNDVKAEIKWSVTKFTDTHGNMFMCKIECLGVKKRNYAPHLQYLRGTRYCFPVKAVNRKWKQGRASHWVTLQSKHASARAFAVWPQAKVHADTLSTPRRREREVQE